MYLASASIKSAVPALIPLPSPQELLAAVHLDETHTRLEKTASTNPRQDCLCQGDLRQEKDWVSNRPAPLAARHLCYFWKPRKTFQSHFRSLHHIRTRKQPALCLSHGSASPNYSSTRPSTLASLQEKGLVQVFCLPLWRRRNMFSWLNWWFSTYASLLFVTKSLQVVPGHTGGRRTAMAVKLFGEKPSAWQTLPHDSLSVWALTKVQWKVALLDTFHKPHAPVTTLKLDTPIQPWIKTNGSHGWGRALFRCVVKHRRVRVRHVKGRCLRTDGRTALRRVIAEVLRWLFCHPHLDSRAKHPWYHVVISRFQRVGNNSLTTRKPKRNRIKVGRHFHVLQQVRWIDQTQYPKSLAAALDKVPVTCCVPS